MASSAPSIVNATCSPEERALRVDLAAAYRLVAHFYWDDLVFTHISARVPGPEHHFLINPYGMMFEEITASSLVKINLRGEKVSDSPWPVNPAGFTIHSAIHGARSDVQCVLHTHTLNGVAVSAQRNGVLPVSQQSIFVVGNLAYHDYEGVALRDDEKGRLVEHLGSKSFLMLRNHGLLTCGRSIPEAFQLMYVFESACAIQIRAQSGGSELIPIQPGIIATAAEQARLVSTGLGPEKLLWPGLLRRLDRLDPSYRD
jgi:ribulose-5-phosphate 4-epimerase/fuculose-1-phosphate aldolase